MKAKSVKETSLSMSHLMTPQDANIAGNVHGGVIMKLIDDAAGTVAARHSTGNAVTASIDRLSFFSPVFIGNLLTLRASINHVGRTSMEIGVRVEAEDIFTGVVRHTASAYLTFVALDENLKPKEIPGLILENDNENRRYREAIARRQNRLNERKKEEACQKGPDSCSL
ncbi:MAG TPA: acyl-CoA thioesterase [Desulfomonilia bacterium]